MSCFFFFYFPKKSLCIGYVYVPFCLCLRFHSSSSKSFTEFVILCGAVWYRVNTTPFAHKHKTNVAVNVDVFMYWLLYTKLTDLFSNTQLDWVYLTLCACFVPFVDEFYRIHLNESLRTCMSVMHLYAFRWFQFQLCFFTFSSCPYSKCEFCLQFCHHWKIEKKLFVFCRIVAEITIINRRT